MTPPPAAAAHPPYRVIMASAGSGKTYTLAVTYIGILRRALAAGQEQAVERILATTFTRAAAGEITDRILQLLADAVQQPDKCAELAQHLGASLSQDQAGELLETMVRHLHRLRIGTLDSFLIRAAMAFAPELGLPTDWRIADNSQDQAIRGEAIEVLLGAHIDARDSREQMIDLLIKLHYGKFPRAVASTLVDAFKNTYDTFLASSWQAWEVIGAGAAPLDDDQVAAAIADLQAALPRMHAAGNSWGKIGEHILNHAQAADWDAVFKKECLCDLAAGLVPTFSRQVMPAPVIHAFLPLVRHAKAFTLRRIYDANVSARDLLDHFHKLYTRLKDARGAYGFGDFPRKLTDANILQNPAAFFFRLDGQIDHILLDEFQDTSITQWNLLEPLVEEIVAGQGRDDTRTFLCVGDVKQTLFAWRHAEPQLFGELLARWKQIQSEQLVKSYRSSQVIIDTVNRVFQNLPDNPALSRPDDDHDYLQAAAHAWKAWFEPHTTVHDRRPGFVRLHTCAEGDNAMERQIAAIERAAELVCARLAESPGEEIGVLFRRKKQIPRLIELLRRNGVLAAGEGGSPLTDDPAVCAAVALLHLLDHPADSAAAYLVGTSPLGAALGITDPMRPADLAPVLLQIRRRLADIGPGGVRAEWLGKIAANCDMRDHSRFTQLIAVAHKFADQSDLGAMVAALRDMRVENAAAARVRVMTIHAAKGRQFDTVILPDLDSDSRLRATLLTRRPHVLDPFDCATHTGDKKLRDLDPTLSELYQSAARQDLVEELCGLYVAMTRAKFGLEMIVHPKKPGKDTKLPLNMAGVLRERLVPSPVAAPSTLLWEAPHSALPPPIPAKSSDATTPPLVVRVDPVTDNPRLRPSVAPSSLEGGGLVDLSRTLTFTESRALDRGTLFHRCFEKIEWLNDGLPPQATLQSLALDLALPPAEVTLALREFAAACAKPNLKKLLARPREEATVWRERPFVVRQPNPAGGPDLTVAGQFDRVVITCFFGKPVSAHLIDYKTDAASPADGTLAERVAHYTPQLQAYRRAAATLLALPETAITASLVFLRIDTIVNI